MRSRWFVCDMDDGVLRIEDSRKAAVEWLRHLHGAPKDKARMSGLDAAIELPGGVAERELRSDTPFSMLWLSPHSWNHCWLAVPTLTSTKPTRTCSGWLHPSRRTVALRWGKFGWCGRLH